jgi:signal transduction histidine kinase/ABC-type sugar transport system substrate-binding protein/AraC-like DNA-binding protein
MNSTPGININILIGDLFDPFWGQVLEGVHQAGQEFGVTITNIMENLPFDPSRMQELALLEELMSQNLDVLIEAGTSRFVVKSLLEHGTALVRMVETDFRHPLSVSPLGLYDAAQMAGNYLAEILNGKGRILLVGGVPSSPRSDTGESRVQGFKDVLQNYPEISIEQLPSGWLAIHAQQVVSSYLTEHPEYFDAIFGISDTLALSARDAADKLGYLRPGTHIVGINGDPLALAAIGFGTMSATIETSPLHLGRTAVEMAYRISTGQPVPEHFPYKMRLVTSQNINTVSAEKLISLAEVPSRLVNFDHQQYRERMRQLETSLEINHQLGTILDLHQLSTEITNLICTNFNYDEAQLYRWLSDEKIMIPGLSNPASPSDIALEDSGDLGDAIQHDHLIWYSNIQGNKTNRAATRSNQTGSRLILPIHFSGRITHVLDLFSQRGIYHTRQELIGLQSLADQFGTAIRNTELYIDAVRAREEALTAQAQAEKANNLKTRLLANVSQELRVPLSQIVGHSISALANPNSYGMELPVKLRNDMDIIHKNGEHLLRLINDLLDLSRAEINELDLSLQLLNPGKLMLDAFHGTSNTTSNRHAINWQIEIPAHLPMIMADPTQARRIVYNLLSNAEKFTTSGKITLGAKISPPHLHLWVEDTGPGIPVDIQERIFEPFVTGETASRHPKGIGLGLTITRRLVALHGGSLQLESQPGKGSTFHVFLPLPNLANETLPPTFKLTDKQPVVLLVSQNREISETVVEFCSKPELEVSIIELSDDLNQFGNQVRPQAILWDSTQRNVNDLAIINKISVHPQLSRCPFLLFGEEDSAHTGRGIIGNYENLIQLIQSMQTGQTNRTILFIDDHVRDFDMQFSLLGSQIEDHQIVTVDQITGSIGDISLENPSLVIVNLGNPENDDFSILALLRERENTAGTPVLITSKKPLSDETISRLNYERVIYHTSDILSPEETSEYIKRILKGKHFLPQPTSILVKQCLAYLHQNYTRPFTLQEIASTVGISKNYLSQIFRDEMSLPIWEYLNRYRVQLAKEYLRSSVLSVTEISIRVGFEDFSYFGRVFNKYCACSPRAYRQKGLEQS